MTFDFINKTFTVNGIAIPFDPFIAAMLTPGMRIHSVAAEFGISDESAWRAWHHIANPEQLAARAVISKANRSSAGHRYAGATDAELPGRIAAARAVKREPADERTMPRVPPVRKVGVE